MGNMLGRLARLARRADGEGAAPTARLCRLTLGVGLAALVLHAYARWWGAAIWDDAFIFQRYANHVAAGDGVAFNPGGSPAYGLTALLYLLPVTVVRAAVGDAALAAMVTSSLCAAVALGLSARLAFVAAGRGRPVGCRSRRSESSPPRRSRPSTWSPAWTLGSASPTSRCCSGTSTEWRSVPARGDAWA